MKMIKNNLLSKNDKYYKKIKYILELISDYYELIEPAVIGLDIFDDYDYNLIVYLHDDNFDTKTYKIMLCYDDKLPILVRESNKEYLNEFKISIRGLAMITKSIYENKENNIILEKNYFKGNKSYKEKEVEIEDKRVLYDIYDYTFKNQYLDANIKISFPKTHPFVENLFAKSIIDTKEEIDNIDTLYCFIKHCLSCKYSYIIITNKKDKDYEKISSGLGKLYEYRRIVGNKLLEYIDGYDKVQVTEYKNMDLDNSEFQKVLRMVRSK